MVYGPSTNYSQPYYAAARPEIPNPGLSYSTPRPPQLKGRYVSSIDEVRAAQIDFDGSLNIYPDMANQCIYTKQVNMDGTATLKVYKLVNDTPPAPSFVTKEELDAAIQQLRDSLVSQEKEMQPKKQNPGPVPAF